MKRSVIVMLIAIPVAILAGIGLFTLAHRDSPVDNCTKTLVNSGTIWGKESARASCQQMYDKYHTP